MTATEAGELVRWVLWPIAATIVLIGGSAFLALTWARRKTGGAVRGERSLLIAVCVLGVAIGFSTSHSREPAVGAVLPALIALMSSAFTYAVTKEGLSQYRTVLPHCITVLSVASLVGLSIGSTQRQRFDQYERREALVQLRYEKFDLETAKADHLAKLEVWKAQQLATITPSAESETEK